MSVGLTACVDGSPAIMESQDGTAGSSGTTVATTTTTTQPPPNTTDGGPIDTSLDSDTGDSADTTSATTDDPPDCAPDCPAHALDVLFVVDNSRTMGPDQLKLATAVSGLIDQLTQLESARGVVFDLNMMVTNTDMGNPLCTPFKPDGYSPAQGAPISTGCNARIGEFNHPLPNFSFPEACTATCPVDITPDAEWVHMVGDEDNVPDGTAVQAMECLLPQGLIGCGYESPLETALQALNPGAIWNQGDGGGFMRDDADLAIVLLTDEMDCSVLRFSFLNDLDLMSINPNTGEPSPSSAQCWNAGVTCDGPDADGIYSNCTTMNAGLHPIDRYTSYMAEYLPSLGKEVMMLGLVGIPPVTQHAARPPFEPTAGGVDGLIYREWIDGQFPAGDITPVEAAMGVDAAEKTWMLGAGPGCTAEDNLGFYSQGQPPPRIREVCEALDVQGGVHCCLESICDPSFEASMTCLRGMIETTL